MAGFYPDVPAPRIAYDKDGSTVLTYNYSNSTTTIWSLAQMQEWNDEDEAGPGAVGITSLYHSGWFTIIFPNLRDIYGYFKSGTHHNAYGIAMQTSANTTNGVDGTWAAVGNQATTGSTWPSYRSGIQSVSWLGIKAVRLQMGNENWSEKAFHLYGVASAGENPDRLRLWHPTLDEALDDATAPDGAYLDWGDVARNTTQDRTFRIKNNSATFTANSVAISTEVISDTTPAIGPQMTFSDGGVFATSVNIGNLAPGGISPIITMRRTTPTNATLSVWSGRVNAIPGSWT